MKKVLKITEHKDGTYSLNNLTHIQVEAIQCALIQNWNNLRELQESLHAEGLDLNAVATYYLTFANEASDQLTDMGF